ncbi:ROK family protein [Sulfobacillus sp. hq2]|uniref:Glucokinase n=1 Tax=Sulfobacillus thermotolerans TaxID=338644 RepID=A0ABM6RRU2_9FIRM|nr:ROK family protein [Sulfobacillus sp. hq2]AUW94096.1 hypothetical protein BXT84_09145 [Sulfobacillus thermotolerans]MCY0907715.1 ROK family protein [Sulfobacillus thermotolerans]
MDYFAGVDIGGTKIAVGIGDASGRILLESQLVTADLPGGGEALDAITAEIDALCQRLGIERAQLRAIGVGSPGPLNGGKLFKTANLPAEWEGLDIEGGLRLRSGILTVVENDATAAAMGEWLYGAGKGLKHMVYVTISTGIGAGMVVNGMRDAGVQGNAGEFGHIVMKPDGPLCRCGKHGCLETLASGTAIARMAAERLADSPFLQQSQTIDAALVFSGANAQDATCQSILDTASFYLGLGLSYLVNLYNPEMIVLGGGVMANHHEWIQSIHDNTQRFSMDAMFPAVRIVPAQLGTASGMQGALAAAVMGQTRI